MNVLQRIENILASSKRGTKTYSTPEMATYVGGSMGERFNKFNGTNVDVEFIVVYVPSVARYTVVFNLTKWCATARVGTYLGWFAQKGFFSI
jgi:hypothetical protein